MKDRGPTCRTFGVGPLRPELPVRDGDGIVFEDFNANGVRDTARRSPTQWRSDRVGDRSRACGA